ncbi:DUF4062 domain-containing protein [Candidatus Enterococcus clewellii]|uniref:DUF4062 domain-containing protein n=1 Tax=Candidatus Enterococcus clewellii TaxID=1834193 RepID=A0A242KCF2_9ENTE|nr:DUF4062 domain-containing protein [Enterococcus sp. 9E7_DIV0242]OTP18749.1 hypothetical protein A5888_000563 [Enterococcus sp. 9E7_DIV0242]
MERKLQVFISSTYTDLKKERQKAVEAILSSGDIPAGMELFQAGDDSQKELIQEWIEESDVYMLLLGGRYGSVDETGQSYTEWEYRQAQKLGKPMFALVLTDEYLKAKISDPTDEVDGLEYELNNQKYKDFNVYASLKRGHFS